MRKIRRPLQSKRCWFIFFTPLYIIILKTKIKKNFNYKAPSGNSLSNIEADSSI